MKKILKIFIACRQCNGKGTNFAYIAKIMIITRSIMKLWLRDEECKRSLREPCEKCEGTGIRLLKKSLYRFVMSNLFTKDTASLQKKKSTLTQDQLRLPYRNKAFPRNTIIQ